MHIIIIIKITRTASISEFVPFIAQDKIDISTLQAFTCQRKAKDLKDVL